MVIVDSSVLIDYFADRLTPHTLWLDRQLPIQRLGVPSLVQLEVLQGAPRDKLFQQMLIAFRAFATFETGSSQLAIAAARNLRALRKAGITVRSSINSLIATFCIQEEHELLHNGRDFDAFEKHLGLRVIHPPAVSLH